MPTPVLRPPMTTLEDQRRLGEQHDTPPAPPIGQDARRHFQQRHHRRIGGSHDRDAAVVEADVGHEELLDRHPQRHVLQERAR